MAEKRCIDLYAQKDVPDGITIAQIIRQFFDDLLASENGIIPGEQTKPLNRKISLNGALLPLFEYRINEKYRFFYTTLTSMGNQYFILLDAEWEHKHNRHPLLKSADHRDKVASQIITAIQAKEAELLNVDNQIASAAKTRVHYRGSPCVFTAKQAEIPLLAEKGNVLLMGSAGSGKTLQIVHLARTALAEVGSRVIYFTLSSELASDVRKEFEINTVSHAIPPHIKIQTWDDFVAAIARLDLSIPEVDERSPTDYQYFCNWKNKSGTLTFRTATPDKNSVEESKIDLSKIKPHELYAEFIHVIMQPGVNLESAYLSQNEYDALGEHQSYFSKEMRSTIYRVFLNYLSTIPESHFEPHVKMHTIACLIRKNRGRLATQKLPTHFYIDEVQQLHPWQLHALTLLSGKTTRFFCAGDPHQLINGQRLKTVEPIEKVFKAQELEITVAVLDDNLRNALLIAAAAKFILRFEAELFGSRERAAHFNTELPLHQVSRGEIKSILYNPNQTSSALSAIAVSPETMMLVPGDIELARTFFQMNNVAPFSAACGREWSAVIIHFPRELYGDIAKILCDKMGDARQCINSLCDDAPYARGKNKVTPSLVVSDFLDVFYTLVTRARGAIILLTDDPRLNQFLNDVITLLSEKISTRAEVPEKQPETDQTESTSFYPDEWVETAKRNIADANLDIQAAGRALLWGHEVWGSSQCATDAKNLFETIKAYFNNEVAFVEAFADRISELLSLKIGNEAQATIFQFACEAIKAPNFFNDIKTPDDFKKRLSIFYTQKIDPITKLGAMVPQVPHESKGHPVSQEEINAPNYQKIIDEVRKFFAREKEAIYGREDLGEEKKNILKLLKNLGVLREYFEGLSRNGGNIVMIESCSLEVRLMCFNLRWLYSTCFYLEENVPEMKKILVSLYDDFYECGGLYQYKICILGYLCGVKTPIPNPDGYIFISALNTLLDLRTTCNDNSELPAKFYSTIKQCEQLLDFINLNPIMENTRNHIDYFVELLGIFIDKKSGLSEYFFNDIKVALKKLLEKVLKLKSQTLPCHITTAIEAAQLKFDLAFSEHLALEKTATQRINFALANHFFITITCLLGIVIARFTDAKTPFDTRLLYLVILSAFIATPANILLKNIIPRLFNPPPNIVPKKSDNYLIPRS